MERIEVNLVTGERKVIQLTAEEIADAQQRTAAEAVQRSAKDAEKALIEKRAAAIDALLAEQAKRADAPQAVKDFAASAGK